MAVNSQHVWMPYCGAAPLPSEWLGRWNLDPVLLVILALLPLAYQWLFPNAKKSRRAAFGAAWLLSVLLFVSPFCALTSALFSARVVHHVLLTAAVAPLLVLSIRDARFGVPGGLAFWTAVQALIFWAWHSPSLYALALSNDSTYWAMQLSLLGSAAAFWAVLHRCSAPAAVAALLATMVQMGLLGALITFSGSALYSPHFAVTEPWGLAALEDQQLAGLIMWAPAAGFYLAAALFVAGRLLGPDREARTAA